MSSTAPLNRGYSELMRMHLMKTEESITSQLMIARNLMDCMSVSCASAVVPRVQHTGGILRNI
jgi:hypothetical protein